MSGPVDTLSERALRRWAWAASSVILGCMLADAIVTSLDAPERTGSWASGTLGDLAFVLVIVSFPLVGLLILIQQPRNRIGWLLQGVGLAWALPGLLYAYAHWGLVVDPGSVPGAGVAAAVNEGTWTFGIGTMGIFLILLFPNGRLPSPRWRVVAWVGGGSLVVVAAIISLSPGGMEEGPVPGMQNPVALESLEPVLIVALGVALPLLPLSILASAVALVRRFRGSQGVEREQIKWLATAGAVVASLYLVTMVATLAASLVLAQGDQNFGEETPGPLSVLQEVSLLSFLLLPVAIGVAILRHRLYDIDRLINRALVYGALTATLAAVYIGSVLLLQRLLSPVADQSELAVAASTLTVAGLFGPARRRIQRAVDRRFYRRRYDAARTLDAFAGRLRHEVDLDAVGADLRTAVDQTVQPTHVSLWVRP